MGEKHAKKSDNATGKKTGQKRGGAAGRVSSLAVLSLVPSHAIKKKSLETNLHLVIRK